MAHPTLLYGSIVTTSLEFGRTRGCKWSADAGRPNLMSPSPLSFAGKVLIPGDLAQNLLPQNMQVLPHGCPLAKSWQGSFVKVAFSG